MSTLSAAAATGAATPATAAAHADSSLGKDAFLNLLVTQLKHQDPMNPMDDQQFMGQMAQFSTLEQITNLNSSMTAVNFGNEVTQAAGLIGHEITWDNGDGTTGSGVPSKVTIDGQKISLTVGDASVDPTQVTGIGALATSAAATAGTATGGSGQ